MRLYDFFRVIYWAWIATEIWVAVRTRTRSAGRKTSGDTVNGDTVNGDKVNDRGSMAVLWVVTFTSMGMGFWASAAFPAGRLHGVEWMGPVGLGIMAAGLAVRWSAILTLGKAFSANVAIREKQTLNQSGLFRYMRHPSYTGMVLIFVGMGLWSRNWLATVFFVAGPLIALQYRIHVEEAALRGAFGEQYVAYSRTTKRLFPGVY